MVSSNRTPAAAQQELSTAWQQAVSCFGTGKVVSTKQPGGSLLLTVNRGAGLRLRGRDDVHMDCSMKYHITGAVRNGGYAAEPFEYIYTLTSKGSAIAGFHWHPSSSSRVSHPHVHLYVSPSHARLHIPTGPLRIEDVLLYAVGELGASPVNGNWDRIARKAMAAAVRWLRAEYSTTTEARAALGVRSIIDDAGFYDSLKLLAAFVRMAGFSGLLVCLDEMVNVYRMANAQARNSNYEQLLRIVNDCLQGSSSGIGFMFGTTAEALSDTRRGVFSYPALKSRLEPNPYARNGFVDLTGPVLSLENLSPEEMYVLLWRLRHVYACGDPDRYLVPDDALRAFMRHCSERIGDAYFRTPRNTVKESLGLLAVLDHNPEADWADLVGRSEVEPEADPDDRLVPAGPGDVRIPDDAGQLAGFEL